MTTMQTPERDEGERIEREAQEDWTLIRNWSILLVISGLIWWWIL